MTAAQAVRCGTGLEKSGPVPSLGSTFGFTFGNTKRTTRE